jgi:hypothetical protein
VLRRIFVPIKEEVTEGWKKKFRTEKIHNSYSLRDIIMVIKSRYRESWSMEKKINKK